MIFNLNIFAQSSFELTGIHSSFKESSSLLNSFESNVSNYSLLRDWGFTISYSSEFSEKINSNVHLFSLSKRLSNHFIYLRYTPGYQKDFLFNTGESIIFGDSSVQTLSSTFSYKELFGSGYSFKFSDNFTAGLSLRYFTQEFNIEYLSPVFGDSIYILRENETESNNFWRGDIGVNYSVSEKILLSASSINLFTFGESTLSSGNESLSLNKDKAALFGFSYQPVNELGLSFIYETTNSFQSGVNTYFKIGNGNLGAGITAFHDKYQSPFIAGIIPSLSYSTNRFGVTLSGVKYFSERTSVHSFSEFSSDGLSNLINNRYSFDKALLTLSLTLNTIKVQSVQLADVEVINEIYPTLSEFYLDSPFAIGKVINLTSDPVKVKPYSRIRGINQEDIQSPEIIISGMDTIEVQFYTLIPESYSSNKTEISYADFYVSVSGNDADDQFQKAVLVKGSNAWDGKVSNLKYFIRKDMNYSMNYSREILSKHKTLLDTVPFELLHFYKTKIIFNETVKDLIYTSDPRASAEYVQFPNETIKLKGGDCDDLSVLFSSLLESVGVETALVDYKADDLRHVNILVNTKLKPEEAKLISENDNRYILRKNEFGTDEVWLPVEVTSLSYFDEAWSKGVEKFNKEALNNFGLVKGLVEIIDIY